MYTYHQSGMAETERVYFVSTAFYSVAAHNKHIQQQVPAQGH